MRASPASPAVRSDKAYKVGACQSTRSRCRVSTHHSITLPLTFRVTVATLTPLACKQVFDRSSAMFAGAIANSPEALERELSTGKQIDVLTHM